MNSRERARLILNHQEADRPAIDLGSTVVTGTTAWTYRELKRALGLPTEPVRVHEMFQMLADVDTALLDELGGDFVMLPKEDWLLGLKYGEWKPYTFWDRQTFDVPVDFNPTLSENGALEVPFNRGGPIDMRMPKGGWFFDFIPEKMDPEDFDYLQPESEWKFVASLPDELLRSQETRARRLYETTERALVAEPPVFAPAGMGGLYYWAIHMRKHPDYCLNYMMRAAEATVKCYEQYLQAVGPYIDVLITNLADFGSQEREIFHPELFAEFYVPAWKLVSDVVHRYPHLKTWIHCCGSVPKLIQHFINAGVDCLNPVQWTAHGMDLCWMKENFGDKLVFWGGAISSQRVLPFGSPEEVAREARAILDIMAPGGGFVVNSIHNILPEVPVENIIALYKSAKAYRYPKSVEVGD